MRRPGPLSADEPFASVLVAAQAGAHWAFERLYLSVAPAVAGYLRAQGGSEPEDMTSDVFERAFTGLGRFTGGEAQFRSWVFTIAHHRLMDDRRQRARRPPPDGEPPERATCDVEADALRRLATERVRRLCDGLAPDQRDVLMLRMVAGLTLEETAGVTGKSLGAVKALQHRGVASLRRLSEREGVSR